MFEYLRKDTRTPASCTCAVHEYSQLPCCTVVSGTKKLGRINQSINPSIHPSIHLSIYQSINQSSSRSRKCSISKHSGFRNFIEDLMQLSSSLISRELQRNFKLDASPSLINEMHGSTMGWLQDHDPDALQHQLQCQRFLTCPLCGQRCYIRDQHILTYQPFWVGFSSFRCRVVQCTPAIWRPPLESMDPFSRYPSRNMAPFPWCVLGQTRSSSWTRQLLIFST